MFGTINVRFRGLLNHLPIDQLWRKADQKINLERLQAALRLP